jgi:phage repressor protein C with HTH and peptisase S24 domain
MNDQRDALDRLIKRNKDNYSALSRLIGRNPAYLHQFVNRGSPKRLSEQDRATLARHFQIDEVWLGGTAEPRANQNFVELVFYNSCTDRGSNERGTRSFHDAPITFDTNWLKSITSSNPVDLCLVRATDDSMSPLICNGDIIMVDRSVSPFRDGIYAFERDAGVFFRRIAVRPDQSGVTLVCDNNLYPVWEHVDPARLSVIGNAIWIGRKIL